MPENFRILEDHRLASAYEVRERSRDELTYLPHIAGDDLQVLCDEIAGHVLQQRPEGAQILVFAPGGTAAFLARYLASFAGPVRFFLWIEPGYDSIRLRAEILQHKSVQVVPQDGAFAGQPGISCVVLAPVANLLVWMDVVRRTVVDTGCRYLAYDPERELRNYSPEGSYAYAVSRIWCGR